MNPRPSPGATRLPDAPARPLRLADGNAWGFALPGPRLSPLVVRGTDPLGRATETVTARVETGYPLEIRRLWERLRASHDAGSLAQQYEAFLDLAVALLRRAHDVSPSDARALLAVADAEWPRLVADILALVTGVPTGAPSPSTGEIA